MFGVLGNLESIAGMISGQVGDQDQRLSGSLLIVVHSDTVRFDFGHLIVPLLRRYAVIRQMLPALSINFQVMSNDHFSEIDLLDLLEQLIVGDAAVRSSAGRVIDDQNSRLGAIGNLRQFTG